MKETNTGQPESQQPKTNIIDFEAAAQKRRAAKKPHQHPQTPPRSRDDKKASETSQPFPFSRGKNLRTWATREEMDKWNAEHGRPPLSDEAWEHTEEYSRQQDAKYEAQRQERDEVRAKAGFHREPDEYWERFERLWENDFPPEETEEFTHWVNEHNEKNNNRKEKERLEKEKIHEDALRGYTRAKEQRAKMTPEELEAEKKWKEEMRRGFEHFLSPEGRKEYVISFVRDLKASGILPPDLDHFWVNLPSGWAEYRETTGAQGRSVTVTLGDPTDEQYLEYYADLQEKMQAWKAEKARREVVALHAGDPLYDPMTGDLLLPDEHPLDAQAEYTFDGKTRSRRFVPPDSQYVNNGYKPVQTDGEDTPENEHYERLVKRLLKAGFIEVEPTLMDKASFEKVQWYRSLSPAQKLAYLKAWHEQMSVDNQSNKARPAAKPFWEVTYGIIEEILRSTAEEMARLMNEPEQEKISVNS